MQKFADDYDYNFRANYSGRGMYGNQCIGFVTDNNQNLFVLGLNMARFLTEHEEHDLLNDLETTRIRTDSMGMGQIVYFPDMAINPSDEEEELEDDDHPSIPTNYETERNKFKCSGCQMHWATKDDAQDCCSDD